MRLTNQTKVYNGITVYKIQYDDKEGGYIDNLDYIQEDCYIAPGCIVCNSFITDGANILGNTNIVNSTINGGIIRKSLIRDSILISSSVNNSFLSCSRAKNCNLTTAAAYDSKIENVVINNASCKDCALFDCIIKYDISNARIKGPVEINTVSDCIVFKQWWDKGIFFNYIPKTKTWYVGNFIGTSEELLNESNKYKSVIELINNEYKLTKN